MQFLNEFHQETAGFTPNKLQKGSKNTQFLETIITNPFIPPIDTKLIMTVRGIQNKHLKGAQSLNEIVKPTEF